MMLPHCGLTLEDGWALTIVRADSTIANHCYFVDDEGGRKATWGLATAWLAMPHRSAQEHVHIWPAWIIAEVCNHA